MKKILYFMIFTFVHHNTLCMKHTYKTRKKPFIERDIIEITDSLLKKYSKKEEFFKHKNDSKGIFSTPIDSKLAESAFKSAPHEIHQIARVLIKAPLNSKWKPSNLLLVGPPGSGKTTLAKAFAQKIRRPFVFWQTTQMFNKYKDSGSDFLHENFKHILSNNKPCVVILDDVHLLGDRYEKKNNNDKGSSNAFWSILDTCENNNTIFFICTANYLKTMPDQILTRFADTTVKISTPTNIVRKNIFAYYLSEPDIELAPNCDEKYINAFIQRTQSYSPRIITKLIKRAMLFCINRTPINQKTILDRNDFEYALEAVIKSLQIQNEDKTLVYKTKKLLKKTWKYTMPLIRIGIDIFMQRRSLSQQSKLHKEATGISKKSLGIQEKQYHLSLFQTFCSIL